MVMLKKVKNTQTFSTHLTGSYHQLKAGHFTYSIGPYQQLNIGHFLVQVRHQELVGLYVTTLCFRGSQFKAFFNHCSVVPNKVQGGHNWPWKPDSKMKDLISYIFQRVMQRWIINCKFLTISPNIEDIPNFITTIY